MPIGRAGAHRAVRPGWFRRPGAATLLLLGPCVVYLAIFAIYPLVYSLRLSLTDLTAADGTGRWVGLRNYADLLADPQFWNAAQNSAVMVGAAVVLQVVLGTALALFFSLQLHRRLDRPGHPGAADADHADRGRRDVAGAAQSRLGPRRLADRGGRVRAAELAGVDPDGHEDAGAGRRLAMDPLRLPHRLRPLQALPQDVFEAARMDGAGAFGRFRHVTLPLLMPAIVFAAVFRAVDAFRSFDLIYGLSYGGPARSTTTLSFFSFQNGFQFQNYGYAAAVAYTMLLILMVGTTLLFRLVRLRSGVVA